MQERMVSVGTELFCPSPFSLSTNLLRDAQHVHALQRLLRLADQRENARREEARRKISSLTGANRDIALAQENRLIQDYERRRNLRLRDIESASVPGGTST